MAKSDSDEQQWLHEVNGRMERNAVTQHLSLPTVISALAFAGSVVYGAWALSQSQLSNVRSEITQLRSDTAEKDSRISAELVRRETELRASIARVEESSRAGQTGIQAELDRRRNEFVSLKEYTEFKDRVLDDVKVLRGQLSVLEATRPTTGELQASFSSLRDRIDRLYSTVGGVEDWIRTHKPVEK